MSFWKFTNLTATSPNIIYSTSLISRFIQRQSQVLYRVAKQILRYLQGTKNYGIRYQSTLGSRLLGNTDSDWAILVDDMKRTSDYALTLNS